MNWRIILHDRPRMLGLVLAIVLASGLASLNTMPRLEDPHIRDRAAFIITAYPGASAARVEALVSEKIENELRAVAAINHLVSVSRDQISFITMELHDHVLDTAQVWSLVRDRLSDVRPLLPADARDPVLDDERFYAYTKHISLIWEGDGAPPLDVMGRLAKDLQNRLRQVAGTEIVHIYGAPDEEMTVAVDPDTLAAAGLTLADVRRALAMADAKAPAGNLHTAEQQILIEVDGAFGTPDRIGAIPVRVDSDGHGVRVGDLAVVRRGLEDPPGTLSIVDGKPAVILAARMRADQRVDLWSKAQEEAFSDWKVVLPENVTGKVTFDQETYTLQRLGALVGNLLLGVTLVVVILLLTQGLRAALVVAVTLPLTSSLALAWLNLIDVEIHQMSVTGLIVALGLLVDNAIVVTDGIRHRLAQGMPARAAALDAVHRFTVPLLGSTVTTVIAFMPIVLTTGPTGEFIGPIGVAVVAALVSSLVVALVLVPALGARFLKGFSGRKEQSIWRSGLNAPKLSAWFVRSLDLSLARPKRSAGLAMGFSVLGFVLASTLTEQFFPPADRDQFHIDVMLDSRASMAETQAVVAAMDAVVRSQPEVTTTFWHMGGSAPTVYYNLLMKQRGAPNYAQGIVTTESFRQVPALVGRLQAILDDQWPQALTRVTMLEQGPPFDAPVELRLFGPDLVALRQAGEAVRASMAKVDVITHAEASMPSGAPKILVDLDEDLLQRTGLDRTAVANALAARQEGAVGGSLVEVSEELPVRVRLANDARGDLGRMSTMPLTPPRVGSDAPIAGVPVAALGTLRLVPGASAINRRDGERMNSIRGYLKPGILPQTGLEAVLAQLDADGVVMPPSVRLRLGGEAEERDDAVGKLLANVPVLLLMMVSTVVLTFNSYRLAAVVGLVALQAMGLGLTSLWISGYPLGFVVMMGLMGLVGLAINAAIIIMTALQADPDAVAGDTVAIRTIVVEECSRHIISTTITTVGGFLPLILAGGGFWPPFAVAIAGGTLLSTIVSFYFVPACFLILTRRRPVIDNPKPVRGRSAPASLTGA